jgi:hypothetical protein
LQRDAAHLESEVQVVDRAHDLLDQHAREQAAQHETQERTDRSEQQRFARDPEEHLLPGRAHEPQLADQVAALDDREGQGVEHQEQPDEQRQQRERLQVEAEPAGQGLHATGARADGLQAHAGRQDRSHALGLGFVQAQPQFVQAPVEFEQLLGAGDVHQHEVPRALSVEFADRIEQADDR